MAQAAPIIAAVAAVGTLGATGYSLYLQNEAAKEAQEIAKMNARRIEEETEEQVRRVEEMAERKSDLIKALAGASGAYGASKIGYLEAFEESKEREIAWLEKSGASRADIARRGGDYSSTMARANMVTTGMQGLGQSANWYMTWADLQ